MSGKTKEFRMGVEWGYLGTLLKIYTNMLESYHNFLLYKMKLAGQEERKKFIAIMSAFHSSVMSGFDNYLEDSRSKIKKEDFQKLDELEDKEIEAMYFELCSWCQTSGPFATLVEKKDPYRAFQNG